ncbi:MAG: hypothetical protein ACOCUE_03710, partial [Candidatus Izemoplasmataceae bacterium]
MLFDFKVNRYIFFIGMVLLFLATYFLVSYYDANTYTVLLVSLAFIFILNFTMKRVANSMYKYMHQLLYIYADAEGYYEQVYSLYKGGAKNRKTLLAAKKQNMVLASLFAGDLKQAGLLNTELLDMFKSDLEKQPQMRFSQRLIEAIMHLFTYNKEMLNESITRLEEEIERLNPSTKEYVLTNDYSIYTVIKIAKSFLEKDEVDSLEVKESLKDKPAFLVSSVVYALLKN